MLIVIGCAFSGWMQARSSVPVQPGSDPAPVRRNLGAAYCRQQPAAGVNGPIRRRCIPVRSAGWR
ncbi:hypothetical protein M8494_17875 [Serratia ureilytica]